MPPSFAALEEDYGGRQADKFILKYSHTETQRHKVKNLFDRITGLTGL